MSVDEITVPAGVTLVRDIVCNTDSRRPLTMHLLRPETATGPLPVVLWIFGGAYLTGSKDSGIPLLIPFAQRGYAGACIEYRFSTEALFPAQLHDCKTAVRFLRSHADMYGVDPGRIGAWGASSGGNLAALLGVTGDIPELEGAGDWSDTSSSVQAVCDFYGPTDFLQMDRAGSTQQHDAPDSPESRLIGGPIQEHPERVARANPLTYISATRRLPPFLIVHGDQDPLVPFHQSELLVDALRAARADVRFHRIPGGGHGGAAFEADETRRLVADFFDAHLRAGEIPDRS